MDNVKLVRPKILAASHILVRQEFEARDLLKKLEAGESFESLARDFSECSSAKHDGYLGLFNPKQMVPEFVRALLLLKEGEITLKPVKSQFGYHLIRREKP